MISVKNLSKKYNISHREPYYALRDSIAGLLKNPFSFFVKRLKGLSKEDLWAIKDVSFDVKQGEIVGIIGRNGAGKTTLLKLLSRITYPTGGEIRLRGRVGSLLEVGTGFHPELTGRENIYFNGSILGMKKREIDKKFDAIVDFAGVEKFLDTPVKRFSSGMQVRLAFSVAAHLEPEILLVDEVLAVGDSQFQKKCLGKMKDISKGGRTVLLVSHNMSAIRNLCKRTILLENGRNVSDTDTETVISKYSEQNLSKRAIIPVEELELKMEGAINRKNPSIRMKKIMMLNEQGLPCATFNSNETIRVVLAYECINIVNALRIALYIVDEENRAIFTSVNIDNSKEVDFYKRDAGVYKTICCIPRNIFGEKKLFLSVHLEYPKVEHLVFDRILRFDIIFQGYNSISSGFKNSFFRPKLKWETEMMEEINE